MHIIVKREDKESVNRKEKNDAHVGILETEREEKKAQKSLVAV